MHIAIFLLAYSVRHLTVMDKVSISLLALPILAVVVVCFMTSMNSVSIMLAELIPRVILCINELTK